MYFLIEIPALNHGFRNLNLPGFILAEIYASINMSSKLVKIV